MTLVRYLVIGLDQIEYFPSNRIDIIASHLIQYHPMRSHHIPSHQHHHKHSTVYIARHTHPSYHKFHKCHNHATPPQFTKRWAGVNKPKIQLGECNYITGGGRWVRGCGGEAGLGRKLLSGGV